MKRNECLVLGCVFPFEAAVPWTHPEPQASPSPPAHSKPLALAQHRLLPGRLLTAPSAPALALAAVCLCPLSLAIKLFSNPSPQLTNTGFYSYSQANCETSSCAETACPLRKPWSPPEPQQTQTGRAPVTLIVSLFLWANFTLLLEGMLRNNGRL